MKNYVLMISTITFYNDFAETTKHHTIVVLLRLPHIPYRVAQASHFSKWLYVKTEQNRFYGQCPRTRRPKKAVSLVKDQAIHTTLNIFVVSRDSLPVL